MVPSVPQLPSLPAGFRLLQSGLLTVVQAESYQVNWPQWLSEFLRWLLFSKGPGLATVQKHRYQDHSRAPNADFACVSTNSTSLLLLTSSESSQILCQMLEVLLV